MHGKATSKPLTPKTSRIGGDGFPTPDASLDSQDLARRGREAQLHAHTHGRDSRLSKTNSPNAQGKSEGHRPRIKDLDVKPSTATLDAEAPSLGGLRAILNTASGKPSGITWGGLTAPTCDPTVLLLSTSTPGERCRSSHSRVAHVGKNLSNPNTRGWGGMGVWSIHTGFHWQQNALTDTQQKGRISVKCGVKRQSENV